MPRFFFNCEGAQSFQDAEGTDLPNLDAVRWQAIHNASEILKEHADAYAKIKHWRVYVTDEHGATIFAMVLREEPSEEATHEPSDH